MSLTRADEEGHASECGLWYEEEFCTCAIRHRDSYINEGDEWLEWEDQNPPRISKGSKPSFVVRGRSIFTLWDQARRQKDGK